MLGKRDSYDAAEEMARMQVVDAFVKLFSSHESRDLHITLRHRRLVSRGCFVVPFTVKDEDSLITWDSEAMARTAP